MEGVTMYIYKHEYIKPLVSTLGLTAGKCYYIIDGSFESGVYIADDDNKNHFLSMDFLLNNTECLYVYCIHDGKKVKEVDHLKIDKRMIDSYIIDSLFDFRGYTDNEETALKRILDDLKNADIINYTMSRYAEKVYRQSKQG